MLKKILLVAFTLLITLFASVGFAASKYDPAIAAAKAEIPAGVELYGIEEKEGKIELNFYDGNTLLSYEVEVIAATNKVKEIDPASFINSIRTEHLYGRFYHARED